MNCHLVIERGIFIRIRNTKDWSKYDFYAWDRKRMEDIILKIEIINIDLIIYYSNIFNNELKDCKLCSIVEIILNQYKNFVKNNVRF